MHCGGLFRDDDATAATAAEGLVRSYIEEKYHACKLSWSIEIPKPGPILVVNHTDEDHF